MNAVCVPEEVYFGLYAKIGKLTEESRYLKHRNENQFNMILDLRKEITDLEKQNEGLCELVGKTKKDCEKLCAGYSELASTNTQYVDEIRKLKRKLDAGCNTCPDMENTKKKNDELKELVEYKRSMINDLQEKNRILKDSIKQLQDECSKKDEDIRYWKAKSNDYWLRRSIWKDMYYQLKKECDVPDNCVNTSEAALKDADAKIQSANDKATNAKKEAKQAKETAERYREENFVLSRKVDQFKKLNDELIKELARQQNAELILKFDRKGEFNESTNSD